MGVPLSASRLIRAGSFEALMNSSLSFLTMAGGVPAGAATANHLATFSLPRPSSVSVGTSGMPSQRLSASIASARSFFSMKWPLATV